VKKPARRAEPAQKPASITAAHWSGPLPPPAALEQFETIVPGAAERILALAESEHAHRVSAERSALQAEIDDDAACRAFERRGQWMGFTVSVGSVLGAAAVALSDGPISVALALLGVPLMGVARALISGRRADR
jgi:uncharacterized membrane protein